MNILITGGAGFIGRSVGNRLVDLGHKVSILDVKEMPSDLPDFVTYFKSDICDSSRLLQIFNSNQFNGIIHLAAVSRVVVAQNNPHECLRVNVGGISTLLSCVEQTKYRPWLIFGSSREVYGEPTELPVSEHDQKQPINIYGETKLEGEKLFSNFSAKHHTNCTIARFSNVYGNHFDILDRVIPRFIDAIVSNKPLTIEGAEQIIDFTFIDDTVNVVTKIVERLNTHKNIQEEFNVCPGIGWSLFQLIEYIELTTGNKAIQIVNKKRDYDVVRFIGNNEKVKKILKLKEFVALDKGIIQCLNAYKNVK